MTETLAEQAARMREWMRREGIEAHVEEIDGRPVLVPGPKLDRSRQARWDREHRVTVSCSVPAQVAQEFHAACKAEGYTAYGVLRRYVQVIVREHRRITGRRATARPGGPPRSSARPAGVGGQGSVEPLPAVEGRGQVEPGPGAPRGRSPRALWSRPLKKPEPRRPYDWEQDGDALA